uniref:Uncharacterized protein n=1 Tax=Ditylenchus dipsaci TaxID=166011 RepID=A0A915DKK3_9BILA
MRLKLPKQEEDFLASSGDEDMSSVFGGQGPSTSSSMKCSPRPPSTSGDSKMSVEAVSKDPPSPEPISPLSRKPFQLLQQRQYSSAEGSDSATPPASAGAAPDKASKKEETVGASESSSSGASTVATAIAAIGIQSGSGKRRSWRTHYIRPNKSLECDSGIVREEVAASSQSTPIRHSPTSISRRNSGPNGAGTSAGWLHYPPEQLSFGANLLETVEPVLQQSQRQRSSPGRALSCEEN